MKNFKKRDFFKYFAHISVVKNHLNSYIGLVGLYMQVSYYMFEGFVFFLSQKRQSVLLYNKIYIIDCHIYTMQYCQYTYSFMNYKKRQPWAIFS